MGIYNIQMTEAIGMMEGAFFVSKGEIISWINKTLNVNLVKIEQTAPGHIACQIMDILYPNIVPMSKINWKAKHDYEYIQNYKILQNVFIKVNLKKYIEVDKLV